MRFQVIYILKGYTIGLIYVRKLEALPVKLLLYLSLSFKGLGLSPSWLQILISFSTIRIEEPGFMVWLQRYIPFVYENVNCEYSGPSLWYITRGGNFDDFSQFLL